MSGAVSASCSRRSLFSEDEGSMSGLDENLLTTTGATTPARGGMDAAQDLPGEHLVTPVAPEVQGISSSDPE
jgi:hypothetical protein